jgi:hypothetical protein
MTPEEIAELIAQLLAGRKCGYSVELMYPHTVGATVRLLIGKPEQAPLMVTVGKI